MKIDQDAPSSALPPGVRFTCDITGCKFDPYRAPAIFVPHRGNGKLSILDDEWRPVRMFTTLHFCEPHRAQLDQVALVQRLLTPAIKVQIETTAKKKRHADFKVDFEAAWLDWLLLSTPEYRKFLASMGHKGIYGAAELSPDQQRAARWKLGLGKVAS